MKPLTIDQARSAMHRTRQKMEAALRGLSDAALDRPGPDGWSIKDHLAHVAAWERKLLAVRRGEDVPQVLGVRPATWDDGDEDAINAEIHARHHGRAAGEVLAEWRAVRAELLAWLDGLTDADLAGPYNPNDSTDPRTLADGLPGNSFRHEDEHYAMMVRLASATR